MHQDTQIIKKSRKQSVYQQRKLSAEGAWKKFVELLAAASNKDYQYSPKLAILEPWQSVLGFTQF